MARRRTSVKTNTGRVVLSAIKKLMQNTGWTSRTIIKFIKIEYGLTEPRISRKVSRALKRGVKLGLLMMSRGRYRLNDISRLTRPSQEMTQQWHQQRRRRPAAAKPLRMRSRTPSN